MCLCMQVLTDAAGVQSSKHLHSCMLFYSIVYIQKGGILPSRILVDRPSGQCCQCKTAVDGCFERVAFICDIIEF